MRSILTQMVLGLFFLCALTLCAMAQGNSWQTQTRFLSGTGKDDAVMWDFYCTGGRRSGEWTQIAVPSCWEQQGFGAYNYGGDRPTATNPLPNEQGKYRFKFSVPAEWKSKIVRLVFDGSMTDTEVWVNGQLAGPIHQGSFYRFKYDVTPLLKFGESNLLEVTVSKVSTNASVNGAERLIVDYWAFGGIFRPVYLEALPTQFIDWAAVDARADGKFKMDVHLGKGTTTSATIVEARIFDETGAAVDKPFSTEISPGQDVIKLQTKINTPKLWTAETPSLYRVRLTLSEKSKPMHTLTERFGFRTFEVRAGDGLYLNGQKIILKGANRHSFWPETGRTLSRQISYDDVRLMKEMNMNAVRMSHYPPDAHFLEACDEQGLYVLDELGGWQRSYDTAMGRTLIAEMIPRDVNHPSILFWDNGNEGGWNRENDAEFAKWDPQQRTVLHPWELFEHMNTGHYKKYAESEKLLAGPDIYMPTEFMHGLYDGGAGAGLQDYWELMNRSKVGAGGFIWALLDECVARTDQGNRLDCAGNRAPDGIVGPHRERDGSFDTVRDIWSPVQVTSMQKLPDDFQGIVTLENRYDFTNLNICSFDWKLAHFPVPGGRKAGHTVIASGTTKSPDIAPHDTGELKVLLPANWRKADALYLTAKDPAGRELWTWSWSFQKAPDVSLTTAKTKAADVETREDGATLSVQTRTLELLFDKGTGALVEIHRNGKTIQFGNGPRFIAFRRNDRNYTDVAGSSSLTEFVARKEGADVIVEAKYNGALQKAFWKINPAGDVRLDYQYAFDGVVDMIGINFDFPEKRMKGIRWFGMGPYRVWQNRLKGTRLNVWENTYNDSTPGESWVYPEFKGYFRDWKWANFATDIGRIIIMTEVEDSYLGLYKPRDGKDGLLNLPDIGVAFLDVIPAMRNKFHTTDELGPQSKPKQVSAIKRGTIHFRFGD